MSSRCRYCGVEQVDVVRSGDDACPRCAVGASCARCGHPRTSHVGSFRDGRSCAHVWVEGPATLATGCECSGFAPAGVEPPAEELHLAVETRRDDASLPVG